MTGAQDSGSLSRLRERARVRARALAYDSRRSAELASMGFQVLRFWDNEVLNEVNAVLEKIFQTAQSLTPTLSR